MTLTLDEYTIIGTPEEISSFIKLYKELPVVTIYNYDWFPKEYYEDNACITTSKLDFADDKL